MSRPAQFEVRQQLGFVDPTKALNSLQLHKKRVLNEEVDSITHVDSESLVGDAKWPLDLNVQAPHAQLASHAGSVGTLQ